MTENPEDTPLLPAGKSARAKPKRRAASRVSKTHSRLGSRARARKSKLRSSGSGNGVFRWVALILVIVVGASAFGLAWQRRASVNEQNKKMLAKVDQGPTVETTQVKLSSNQQKLVLQGECRPFFEATIFAKVSGYLKTIRVYEGDVVKKGDILATVSSPETDQALISAKADAANKKRVADRYKILLAKQLASPQEAEQAFAESNMANANLQSAMEAKNYETLRAPFDGVVTARFVDPGALIPNASNSRASQLALVTVADMRKLKIDAYVDQRYASRIQTGQAVEIHLPNQTDQKFAGEVARLSGSLDPRTRMLFVEIDFDNQDQKIVSGSFVNIDLTFDRDALKVAPVNALVQTNGKSALAIVGSNHKLKFSPIEIVDNDGTNLFISKGVNEGQTIALNVGSELKDGATVQYQEPKKAPPGAEPAAPEQQGQAPSQMMTEKLKDVAPSDVPAQDAKPGSQPAQQNEQNQSHAPPPPPNASEPKASPAGE